MLIVMKHNFIDYSFWGPDHSVGQLDLVAIIGFISSNETSWTLHLVLGFKKMDPA